MGKRIPDMAVRQVAAGPYANFRGKLPCPPHRHIVPQCSACGHVGNYLVLCLDCKRIINK